eukprot:scaffold1481_cov137-Cylindrotheca_fusiformis.AAC.2
MSTKLLRRLLQQTSEVEVKKNEEELNTRKKNKQRPNAASTESKPLSQEELFNRQVRGILLLDNRMESKGAKDRKNKSVERISAKQKREVAIRKQSSKMILGNSRGASSKMRLKPERTSDKKKYRKEKEEKRLKEIAKLLKKQSKQRKKEKSPS